MYPRSDLPKTHSCMEQVCGAPTERWVLSESLCLELRSPVSLFVTFLLTISMSVSLYPEMCFPSASMSQYEVAKTLEE